MEQCVFNLCCTDGPLPVGRLHINGIGQLVRLNPPSDTVSYIAPSLSDLDLDSDDESGECWTLLYSKSNNDQHSKTKQKGCVCVCVCVTLVAYVL